MAVSSTLRQPLWPTSTLVALALLLTLLRTTQQEPESKNADLVSCAFAWTLVAGLLRVVRPQTGGDAGEKISWRYWTVAAAFTATQWLGGEMKWLWVRNCDHIG